MAPAEVLTNGWYYAVPIAALLIGTQLAARRALAINTARGSPVTALLAEGMLYLLAIAALVALMLALPDPRVHAYAATNFAIVLYALIHCGIGAIMAFYAIWRFRSGFMSPRRNIDLRLGKMWSDYVTLAVIIGLALIVALPWLAQARGGA